jgi:hypothetical protein
MNGCSRTGNVNVPGRIFPERGMWPCSTFPAAKIFRGERVKSSFMVIMQNTNKRRIIKQFQNDATIDSKKLIGTHSSKPVINGNDALVRSKRHLDCA